jgi:hypothetical protein
LRLHALTFGAVDRNDQIQSMVSQYIADPTGGKPNVLTPLTVSALTLVGVEVIDQGGHPRA